jgi:hypothetical protein
MSRCDPSEDATVNVRFWMKFFDGKSQRRVDLLRDANLPAVPRANEVVRFEEDMDVTVHHVEYWVREEIVCVVLDDVQAYEDFEDELRDLKQIQGFRDWPDG